MKHILLAFLLFFVVSTAVSASPEQFRSSSRRQSAQDPDEIKREQDQEKALNKERNKKIKEDTDKLLDLATELKKSVDAAGENTLSLEVIRKTDEIEKLAKQVRGKMKETYNAPDTSHLPDATSR